MYGTYTVDPISDIFVLSELKIKICKHTHVSVFHEIYNSFKQLKNTFIIFLHDWIITYFIINHKYVTICTKSDIIIL